MVPQNGTRRVGNLDNPPPSKNMLNNIDHVIGTSIGSIIGLLLVLKLKPKKIYNFFYNLDIKKFDLNKLSLETLLDGYGLNDMNEFMSFFEFIIKSFEKSSRI